MQTTATMSPIGREIWLHMQRQSPPYNRSSLARELTEDGTYPITSASISDYLYREHPPPKFVNAVARTFGLSPEEEAELHWLYFYGRNGR
jgi:hypothetical protein